MVQIWVVRESFVCFFGLSSCKLGVAVYREGETEWCEFGET